MLVIQNVSRIFLPPDGKLGEDTRSRLVKAAAAWYRVKLWIRGNVGVSIETRTRVAKAVVISTLFYASGTRPWAMSQLKQVDVFLGRV